jgi:hypothetical protein
MKKSLGKIGLVSIQVAGMLAAQALAPMLAGAVGFNVNDKKVKFTLSCDPSRKDDVINFCNSMFTNVPPDDECSALGASNEGTFNPNAPGKAPDLSAGTCSVQVTQNSINIAGGQLGKDAGACKTDLGCMAKACNVSSVNKKKCQLKGSQLQPHCMAYQAIEGDGIHGGVIAGDVLMTVVDFAVAGTCAAECASPGLNVVGQACRIGAMAAGATEMFTSMAMKENGKVAQYIGEFGGVLGIGSGAMGAAAHGLTKNTAAESDKIACVSAGLFAIMGGVRIVAVNEMGNARDEECNSINKLLSDISTFDEKDGAGGGSSAYGNPYAATGSSGTGTGADGSGGTGGNTGSGAERAQKDYNDCRQNGGNFADCIGKAQSVQGLGASDVDLIRKSGLPALPLPNLKELAGKAGKLDSKMFSGGMGGGDLGGALSSLAQAAQENPKELSGLGISSAPASMYASSGGGGGGGGKSDAAANPFANLFGAKDAGPSGGSASSANFGARAPSNDIWHTGTTMNLFEIVSGKVSQVANRVMPK